MGHGDALYRLIEEYRVFHCVECGKCTGACPQAQVDRDFSPRLVAKYAIEEGTHSQYVREKTWACLTCGLCVERCPQGIPFADFVQALRTLYRQEDYNGHMSHGGALHSLMRMQTAPMLAQNRLDWITPELKVSLSQGEVLYFVGCLPYLDCFFSDLTGNLMKISVDTVKILNQMGIEPLVLPDERCCGHDLLWSGDQESFCKLRKLNIESFQRSGVKTIVTACSECSYVLRHLYPDSTESFPFEVMHLSEYLQRASFSTGKKLNRIATYQDPCRLGRFQKVYNAPRDLLGSILELREMKHFGAGAWCCGNSAWLSCDRYSKQIQIERLKEAKDTQSDLMVTACPKCQIHLSCAMKDVNLAQELQVEIQDLSSVIAKSIASDRSAQ